MTANLYRHFAKDGTLLYIGLSEATERRLREHKIYAGWYKDIARIEVEVLPSRTEAAAAEKAAICKERPLNNFEIRHETSMKPAAQRKRDERERMRGRGFVLRQFWVHPKDWERVRTYLMRVNKRRSNDFPPRRDGVGGALGG